MSIENRTSAPAARQSQLKILGKAFLRKPLGVASFVFLTLLSALCILGPVISPYDPITQDLMNVMQNPSAAHWLGTDSLGRDILSRLLHGGALSLIGVLQAVITAMVIGIPLGVLVGYFTGGKLDTVVMRLIDIKMAIPGIIVTLGVLAIFSNSLTAAMITHGVLASGNVVRVVRGTVLTVRQELYVDAARVIGLSDLPIVFRHIMPRTVGVVIVQASMLSAIALGVQTGLAFLGFGPPPPEPTWGGMVSEASTVLRQFPWMVIPTAGLITVTTLAFGLLGDAVRDVNSERLGRPVAPRRKVRKASQAATDTVHVPNTDALLSVRGLTVAFDTDAGESVVVDNVSFDIREGEVLGVLGESGSGKSVTTLAILGLLGNSGSVVTGTIHYRGEEITHYTQDQFRTLRGKEMGLISQEPMVALDPAFRLGYQIAEVVRVHRKCTRKEADVVVLDLLRAVKLPDPEKIATLYPHQVSGGMAQRIVIAMALAGEPRLLIADEPTTALDVTVQAEILDLLRTLQRERGMALLLVTHDWGVVADICQSAVVMYRGKVVEQSTVAQMFAAPDHAYTRALMQSNPHYATKGHSLPTWRKHVEGDSPDAIDALQHIDLTQPHQIVPTTTISGAIPAVHTGAQSGSGGPLVTIDGLCVDYGHGRSKTRVVHDVSFEIPRGTTVGLVGESGSGKSTIGRALLGLVPAAEGSMLYDGMELSGMSANERRQLSRRIQVIFQDPYSSLDITKTIGYTLAEPLRQHEQLGKAAIEERVHTMLDRVGLPADAALRFPAQFSGGQRQRIAIARALIARPDFVVCDEPVSALDLSIQAEVMNLLAELQQSMGLTLLFISHDLAVVKHTSDGLVVLKNGRIVEMGDAETVYENPQHEYTQKLLAASPVPDPEEQSRRRETRRQLATL